MSPDGVDLEALVAEAATILDKAAERFVAGHGADSAVQKKGKDFATEVDLAIEREVVAALVSTTGIGVHGEEFGGADINSPWVWVLDPIDGTFNYAAGLPFAAILLGLMRDGEPVAGLTWVPFTGERFTAVAGGPLRCNGVELPPLEPTDCESQSSGSARSTWNGGVGCRAGTGWRSSRQLSRVTSRIRIHGATGIDLAYTAAGNLGGAISFGDHVWDHAAGVALVRAAGGIVTDLDGKSMDRAVALCVGRRAPVVHGEIIDCWASVGDPGDY